MKKKEEELEALRRERDRLRELRLQKTSPTSPAAPVETIKPITPTPSTSTTSSTGPTYSYEELKKKPAQLDGTKLEVSSLFFAFTFLRGFRLFSYDYLLLYFCQ